MARRTLSTATTTDAPPPPAAAPPAIGHNQPRPMTPEEVVALLTETTKDLAERRAEIRAGVARFHERYSEIPDDEVQGRAADFAGGKGAIAGFLKLVESRRVAEKQPFDRAAAAVQGFFATLTADVTKDRDSIRAKQVAYADKVEAERRAAAEKAAQAAAEAARQAEAEAMKRMSTEDLDRAAKLAAQAEQAAREAAAKPAEFTRTTGGLGTTASLITSYRLNEEQSNLMALVKAVAEGRAPLKYLTFHTVAIGIAIRSEKVREIPGCVIEEVRDYR